MVKGKSSKKAEYWNYYTKKKVKCCMTDSRKGCTVLRTAMREMSFYWKANHEYDICENDVGQFSYVRSKIDS